MKTITINGVEFEVHKSNTADIRTEINHMRNWGFDSIYDAYEKPSRYNVEIWEEWLDWARNCFDENFNISRMCITGPTSKHFSIKAPIYDDNYDLRGYLWITKLHNRVYLCDID